MPRSKIGNTSPTPAQRRKTFNRVVEHAMVDQGIRSQSQLAILMGMDRAAVCRRFNGVVDWQYTEMISLLKIDAEGVAKMMGVAA
mgnify:CR=1 FL=1